MMEITDVINKQKNERDKPRKAVFYQTEKSKRNE